MDNWWIIKATIWMTNVGKAPFSYTHTFYGELTVLLTANRRGVYFTSLHNITVTRGNKKREDQSFW